MPVEHGFEDGQLIGAVVIGAGTAFAQCASKVAQITVQEAAEGLEDLLLCGLFATCILIEAQCPGAVNDTLDVELRAFRGIEVDFGGKRLRCLGNGGYFLLSLDAGGKVGDARGEDGEHLVEVADAFVAGYLKERRDGELVLPQLLVFGGQVVVFDCEVGKGLLDFFLL